MTINGILNTLKPAGQTSFEMVTLVRRLSGQRRVGHAGTLDRNATGVLPICLGQGTRVVEFLVQGEKTYRAQIELGLATDTYDASGRVTRRSDPSTVTREQLEQALTSFRGVIEQTPPMYSAVKHQGKPLYLLARAGVEIPRKPRKVHIFSLEVLEWQPPIFTVEVECSKGTYIRCLAHDLGQKLGCGAHLKSLVRLRSGFFDIRDGLTVSQLEDAFRYGYWHKLIYSIDQVLLHMMATIVDVESERAIRNGRALALGDRKDIDQPEWCRAYSTDGRIIALLQFQPQKAQWQPAVVFT